MADVVTPVVTYEQGVPILGFTRSEERLAELRATTPIPCSSTEEAAAIATKLIAASPVEQYLVLCLDSQFQLIAAAKVSQGTASDVMVHQRETFAVAIACRASYVVLCHNHPSGAPGPSQADRALAKTMDKAGDALGIPVADHLIVHHAGYHSFRRYASTRKSKPTESKE